MRLDLLREHFTRFKASHIDIIAKDGDPIKRIDHESTFASAESAYIGAYSRLKRLLRAKDARTDNSSEVAFLNSTGASTIVRVEAERVPEVGTFNGDSASWPAFKASFTAEVSDRADITDVRKLQILQKSCTGQATETLGPWALRGENFANAWRHLHATYNDDYRIQQSTFDKFMDVPPMTTESKDGIRFLRNMARSALQQLTIIGVDVSGWDVSMINLIARKLPPRTLEAWDQRRNIDIVPNLDAMMLFLSERSRGGASDEREHTGRLQPSPREWRSERTDQTRPVREQVPPRAVRDEYRHEHPRTRNFPPRDRHDGPAREFRPTRTQQNCKICRASDHGTCKCPNLKTMTLQQRTEAIRAINVCKNCLKFGHEASACWGAMCPFCPGEKHNSVICGVQYNHKQSARSDALGSTKHKQD